MINSKLYTKIITTTVPKHLMPFQLDRIKKRVTPLAVANLLVYLNNMKTSAMMRTFESR